MQSARYWKLVLLVMAHFGEWWSYFIAWSSNKLKKLEKDLHRKSRIFTMQVTSFVNTQTRLQMESEWCGFQMESATLSEIISESCEKVNFVFVFRRSRRRRFLYSGEHSLARGRIWFASTLALVVPNGCWLARLDDRLERSLAWWGDEEADEDESKWSKYQREVTTSTTITVIFS